MNIHEKLTTMQNELKVPKGNYNNFGKYNYRNAEDILEGVKPLLLKHGLSLYISDDIISINDRYYVRAEAVLTDTESLEKITNTSFAREDSDKKGMDACQITGSSSSYARKYALNGLFCIDDTKDSDLTNDKDESASDEKSIRKPTDKQLKLIWGKAKGSGVSNDIVNYLLYQVYKVKDQKDLTMEQFEDLCSAIENKSFQITTEQVDVLKNLIASKKLSKEGVSEIVKELIGKSKKALELTYGEANKVIEHLNNLVA